MRWENGRGQQGEEKKEAGRTSLAGQTLESLPRETEGGRRGMPTLL